MNGMRTMLKFGILWWEKRWVSREKQNRWTSEKEVWRSTRKYNYRVSREISVSKMTMWKILWNSLHQKLYKLQTYQDVTPDDKVKRRTLYEGMWPSLERDKYIFECVTFTSVRFVALKMDATNVKRWRNDQPLMIVENIENKNNVSLFSVVSCIKFYDLFRFVE